MATRLTVDFLRQRRRLIRSKSPTVVSPETVVRWHRSGFALYWRMTPGRVGQSVGSESQKRPTISFLEWLRRIPLGALYEFMGNCSCSASMRPSARFRVGCDELPGNPELARRWLGFLKNHREIIAAMDFFTVPTISFRLLYCFFVINHDRRSSLHFNVTQHASSAWVIQQLREAFRFQLAPRFLIFDRDSKFSFEVATAVRSLGIAPVRTSYKSPGRTEWRNDGSRAAGRICWIM